jgi:hypothetical protein
MASALQQQFGQQAQQYGQQYGQAQQQAQNAYGALSDFQKNMQSGTDMYGQQLQAANQNAGYNPGNLQAAQQQVSQVQGILGGLPRAVQAQNANYGATAGDVANQFSTEGANLNQTLGLANTNAANEIAKMQGGLAGAQAATTAGLQGQQNKVAALHEQYTAAQAQLDTAQKQSSFYSNLYQQQGYLDAQQAAAYAQAEASKAQANQLMQQSAQIAQQIRLTQAAADAAQAQQAKSAPSVLTPQQQASANYLKSVGATPESIRNYSYNAPLNFTQAAKSGSPLEGVGSFLKGLVTGSF